MELCRECSFTKALATLTSESKRVMSIRTPSVRWTDLVVVFALTACGESESDTEANGATTFFVTSDSVASGNFGGLEGADQRCQSLAAAAGINDHTFKAYLSTSTVNARDRIGNGPWVNATGVTVAENLEGLHARSGDVDVFLDEYGERIPGQWSGSPDPNVHDILTGTNADGTLAVGLTCNDWTSDSNDLKGQVGHSDGLGPNGSDAANFRSWNSVHATIGSCGDLTPGGGAGKVYCFALDE